MEVSLLSFCLMTVASGILTDFFFLSMKVEEQWLLDSALFTLNQRHALIVRVGEKRLLKIYLWRLDELLAEAEAEAKEANGKRGADDNGSERKKKKVWLHVSALVFRKASKPLLTVVMQTSTCMFTLSKRRLKRWNWYLGSKDTPYLALQRCLQTWLRTRRQGVAGKKKPDITWGGGYPEWAWKINGTVIIYI